MSRPCALLFALALLLLPSFAPRPGLAQIAGAQATPLASGPAGTASPNLRSGPAPGTGPIILPRDFSHLRIEPGDLLRVAVYDAPELSDTYRVDPVGQLTFPLCGKVAVAGRSATDAAKVLETALENEQILIHPQVTVDIEQYAAHFVTVLGEVNSPGRVTVIAPTSLSEILAQVGGLTGLAGTRIKIRHGADDAAAEEDEPYSRSDSNQRTGSILIEPGDTILVPRAGIVYVLGAVYHPGGYVMQEDGKLNVAEALAMSGGTLLTAKSNGLRVIRRGPEGKIAELPLSYEGIAQGTETPLELRAQDIVYVPMSKIKATLADATSILSAATSAAIYSIH
jgi:polysaccharide export outer membrane protein